MFTNETPVTQAKDMARDGALQAELMAEAQRRRADRLSRTHQETLTRASENAKTMTEAFSKLKTPADMAREWGAYMRDAMQRGVITADVLRQRADIFEEHCAAGAPPVLIYDYEVIMEGRDLPRPSNYRLLKITPPKGVEVFDWKRPYVIIDPRAGHGAGIGGFKPDSQVGVALRDGHPVYFVAFHPDPVPGQTIADVTHSEAEFVREIIRRHPDSPKPIIVGNCQGGWATAILAATHPDLTGPIVLNGSPMSYWGGKLGQDPMRYSGGLAAGILPALVSADLGGGVFDGASLVQNFEMLNPGRTWFRKYFDLYQAPEKSAQRFLEFERWWGGFYLMTDAEIRWIVENLFVGNKLGKNEAYLEPGRLIDLKVIRAPIIVFASHGDNITPPAQALNWIVDTYTDETEIEIRGQRILYMVHEQVGHLGIFVSSSVAKREHSEMASTMKTIEALAPGLYEMQIVDQEGEGHEKTFTVSFAKRTMADIVDITGGREDEAAFAGVARASEAVAEAYDTTLGPVLRAAVSPEMGEITRELNPMRTTRRAMASSAPGMIAVEHVAALAQAERNPVDESNPFLMAERLWADMVEQGWDMLRDMRETSMEMGFLALWASPMAMWYGTPHAHTRTRKPQQDLRSLPQVQGALSRMEVGGLAEGVIRMLVLLADSRGDVRKDRLERSAEVLAKRKPFSDVSPETRASIIHEQQLIAHYEPDRAMETLPRLLRTAQDKKTALESVAYIVGDEADMEAATRNVMARFKTLLTPIKRNAAPKTTKGNDV